MTPLAAGLYFFNPVIYPGYVAKRRMMIKKYTAKVRRNTGFSTVVTDGRQWLFNEHLLDGNPFYKNDGCQPVYNNKDY
jgi:hypothetical protein